MTYAAGGTGLNLKCATKVVFLTSQWSPALDWQTFSLALKAGQTKKVTVLRLMASNFVEQDVPRKHPVR